MSSEEGLKARRSFAGSSFVTASTLLRRSFIPFLVLSEPTVFLLYQGGSHCWSLCFRPTSTGVLSLGLVLLGTGLIAIIFTSLVTRMFGLDVSWLDRFARSSTLMTSLLLGIFGAYLFFLTFDATSVPGALWKPIVLR